MNNRMKMAGVATACVLAGGLILVLALRAGAHCDTMDGPVVKDAQAALAQGDATPVLKWVSKEHQDEILAAFKKTLAVRAKGDEAKELADMYFFETLIRIHRAGEGAPYTGLKPSGTPLEPGVAEADKAIATGSADALVKLTADRVADGIRQRFAKVVEAKKHATDSVEAGLAYVAAYVEFVHYVERLHADAAGAAGHEEPGEGDAHHHE